MFASEAGGHWLLCTQEILGMFDGEVRNISNLQDKGMLFSHLVGKH